MQVITFHMLSSSFDRILRRKEEKEEGDDIPLVEAKMLLSWWEQVK
jgi:hypothetical protein